MSQSEKDSEYPTAEQLGDKFSAILKRWLKPWEMREVAKRNREETSEGVCHSHDFCDANMAMDEAWTSFGLASIDGENEFECKLWGAAWNHAVEKIDREDGASRKVLASGGPEIF